MGLWQGGDFEDVSDEPIVRHFIVVVENGFARTTRPWEIPMSQSMFSMSLIFLMIKWDTPDVASRAGVFSMMEEDWMKLDLEWKLITLH